MAKVKRKKGGEAEVEVGTPLREVTKENGWPVAYGCENGLCGTCVVKVNEGMENLNEKTESEGQTLEMMCMEEGGFRLACQCKVNGDIEIETM